MLDRLAESEYNNYVIFGETRIEKRGNTVENHEKATQTTEKDQMELGEDVPGDAPRQR